MQEGQCGGLEQFHSSCASLWIFHPERSAAQRSRRACPERSRRNLHFALGASFTPSRIRHELPTHHLFGRRFLPPRSGWAAGNGSEYPAHPAPRQVGCGGRSLYLRRRRRKTSSRIMKSRPKPPGQTNQLPPLETPATRQPDSITDRSSPAATMEADLAMR